MLAAAVAGLTTMATGTLASLENGSIDLRFGLRGAQAATDVVVVGVDDTTFDQLNRSWPFPRALDAVAIDRLLADRARTIVYDV